MASFRFLPLFLAITSLFTALSAHAATYALCIYETPVQIAARNDPKSGPGYWDAFAAFAEQLKAAGVMRGGSAFDTSFGIKTIAAGQPANRAQALPLQSPTFGGYFIIEVATEAEALVWAARVPNPDGQVEVRVLLPMMAK